MKRITKLLSLVVTAILVFAIIGCAGTKMPAQSVIEVNALSSEVKIKEYDVDGKNFTSYFAIFKDGNEVEVKSEYVDASAVKAIPGEYFVACEYEGKRATIKVVVSAIEYTVAATTEKVALKAGEVEGHDFKQYFTATKDGEPFAVSDDVITSDVKAQEGRYTVTATIEGKTASVAVEVLPPVFVLTALKESVSLKRSEVEGHDFKQYFTATKDDEPFDVTDKMIVSTVKAQPGEYTVVASLNGNTAQLIVVVSYDSKIEAYVTYSEYFISEDSIPSFDVTTLFILFVEGKAERVTADMVDATQLEGATAGDTCDVVLNYEKEGDSISVSAKVTVTEREEAVVCAKNIETYPNTGILDLTSLFTIEKGGKQVEVTADMITGSVDYSRVGENVITLTYEGKTYEAKVNVRLGVVISAPADGVRIRKGTNKETYDFAGDFDIRINGMRFTLIPDEYLEGVEDVDFSASGEYEVRANIPYCTTKPNAWTGTVKFDTVTFAIKYVVIEKQFSIAVKQNEVTLPKGTTSYNVFSNIDVKVDGRKQTLTDNADWVDVITCYARLISAPIDFAYPGDQQVIIDIYPEGVNANPVRVEYTLVVRSDIVITPHNQVVYTGDTVYADSLFDIKEGEEEVRVTYEMIEGKADVFNPGIYVLTVEYKKATAEVRVTVMDRGIIGRYSSPISVVAEKSDDSDYSQWGSTTPSVPASSGAAQYENRGTVKDLVIGEAGLLTVGDRTATVMGAASESVIDFMLGSNKYKMYLSDGIAVLDPNNDIKLGFNNDRRPLVYFANDKWKIVDNFTVNYTATHVLFLTYHSYSIDAIKIRSVQSGEEKWFALKTELVEKTASDTVYKVQWGFAECDVTSMDMGVSASIRLNSETTKFYFIDEKIARTDRTEVEKKYANKTFSGVVDGKEAMLMADRYEAYTLVVDGQSVVRLSAYDVQNMKYGGVDYDAQTVFLHGTNESTTGIFAYKFLVDPQANTFVLAEKDGYFGKYVMDGAYIFLDGYGTGVVNFDTSSYTQHKITYTVAAGELTIVFLDVLPNFKYGKQASFYFDTFGNVLTPKKVEGVNWTGRTLENATVSDGAIVRVSVTCMGAESSHTATNKLLGGIEIISKDGVMDGEQKKSCIDLSTVSFTTPGFYQYTITLEKGGKKVTSYYALQILATRYEGNEYAAPVGKGFVCGHYISIDKYGKITVDCNGTRFEGLADVGEGEFSAIAKSADGRKITLTGNRFDRGISYVEGVGDVAFADYFTVGEMTVIGKSDYILRRVSYAGVDVYFAAASVVTPGEGVTVELISGASITASGAIVAVRNQSGAETVMRINTWGDTQKGIVLADTYRGKYATAKGELVLDGFGTATMKEKKATYQNNGNAVTVKYADGSIEVYVLDRSAMTATEQNIALDETLVKGKSYTASYVFITDDAYSATLTLNFGEDGKVVVVATSAEYDDDTATGTYKPSFAGEGEYQVKGDVITIKINAHTIVLTIDNVLAPNMLVCTSTTVQQDDEGYFSVGTQFTI